MILECGRCGALVEAIPVESYWDSESIEGPANRFSLFRCPKCSGPFLVQSEEDGYESQIVLYPQAEALSPSLPKPIQAAFAEAQACFRAKAFSAAAIMCRKTLEGICLAHEAKARGLVAQLLELKERGVIEQRLYEWAEALRISGNEAAHDVGVTVPQEDARDILEFTNALLEYVFTFRDRFEAFKTRRERRQIT